jgi:hypothetical protein
MLTAPARNETNLGRVSNEAASYLNTAQTPLSDASKFAP